MTGHDVGRLAEGSVQRQCEAQAAMAEADRFEREWEEVRAVRAWLQAVIYHPDRWMQQAAAQRLLRWNGCKATANHSRSWTRTTTFRSE